MRPLLTVLALFGCLAPLQGATLERLTLDEMIAKSTAIVHGKVTGSGAALSGPVIYTHYSIAVSESLKGNLSGTADVVVPGGQVGGVRQFFSGAPVLNNGGDYILMLWTGKNGLTQVIGLTQGLFSVSQDGGTDATATRAETRELMLDRTSGQPVKDQTLTMKVSELRSRISTVLAPLKKAQVK